MGVDIFLVERVGKNLRLALLLNSVLSQEGEFHDGRNRNLVNLYGPAAVVGVDVDDFEVPEEFLKRERNELATHRVEKVVESVKFDDKNSEAPEGFCRRVENHRVLTSLDVHLKD